MTTEQREMLALVIGVAARGAMQPEKMRRMQQASGLDEPFFSLDHAQKLLVDAIAGEGFFAPPVSDSMTTITTPMTTASTDVSVQSDQTVSGDAPVEQREVHLLIGELAAACLEAQSRKVLCGIHLDARMVEIWNDTPKGSHETARVYLRQETTADALQEQIDRINLLTP